MSLSANLGVSSWSVPSQIVPNPGPVLVPAKIPDTVITAGQRGYVLTPHIPTGPAVPNSKGLIIIIIIEYKLAYFNNLI